MDMPLLLRSTGQQVNRSTIKNMFSPPLTTQINSLTKKTMPNIRTQPKHLQQMICKQMHHVFTASNGAFENSKESDTVINAPSSTGTSFILASTLEKHLNNSPIRQYHPQMPELWSKYKNTDPYSQYPAHVYFKH
jgi:hypothetical protein